MPTQSLADVRQAQFNFLCVDILNEETAINDILGHSLLSAIFCICIMDFQQIWENASHNSYNFKLTLDFNASFLFTISDFANIGYIIFSALLL
jgi:hypothetical protein